MPRPLLDAASGGGEGSTRCERVNASSIPTSTAPQQPESTRSAPAGERHQRPAAAVVRPRLRPRAADVGVRPVSPRRHGAQQRPLPGLRPILGPALVRKLRREAVSRVGSWLNYATIHVRPRARPGAPLDCAAWSAALPAWREVEAQMCEAARRYGRGPCEIEPTVRRLYRRHCAGVASGEFAREQGLLQSTRAYQRTLPRLALCGPRDRRAVALRRRGGNWSDVARRCGCSVRTAQGASERLERLKHWENGRLSAGQYVQRASLIRVPDSQICRASKVCTPPEGRLRARASRPVVDRRPGAELRAAVSSSPGTFGWAGYERAGRQERPRAAGPPAALSVHARLRRIGFALLCQYPGLRANPDELADALKWAAARRRLDYNGRIVSAAGAAAWALWRRRWPEAVAARPC